MAQRKIIWSNKAKKKLYAILESDFRKRKNKPILKELCKEIFKKIKPLSRKPGLGIATSDASVFVQISGGLRFFYSVNDTNIFILIVSEIKAD